MLAKSIIKSFFKRRNKELKKGTDSFMAFQNRLYGPNNEAYEFFYNKFDVKQIGDELSPISYQMDVAYELESGKSKTLSEMNPQSRRFLSYYCLGLMGNYYHGMDYGMWLATQVIKLDNFFLNVYGLFLMVRIYLFFKRVELNDFMDWIYNLFFVFD